MRGKIKLTSDSFSHAGRVYSALRKSLPSSRDDLRNYVKVFLGIDVPDVSLCEGHSSPMDYLWHCFSGDFPFGTQRANGDAVVWANRAGGKTQLGAIATLLDCIFKANCQVRILGGSLEQSSRMYEYLAGFVTGGYEDMLSGVFRKGKCQFVQQKAVAKEKIIPRNIPQIESISYICCGEVYEKTSKFERICLTDMCSAPIIEQPIGE